MTALAIEDLRAKARGRLAKKFPPTPQCEVETSRTRAIARSDRRMAKNRPQEMVSADTLVGDLPPDPELDAAIELGVRATIALFRKRRAASGQSA